jgi:hypothetical protein
MAAMRPPSAATAPEQTHIAPPAPSYPFVNWESVTLLDGLVLLVNTNRGEALRRIADEIYRYYGQAK